MVIHRVVRGGVLELQFLPGIGAGRPELGAQLADRERSPLTTSPRPSVRQIAVRERFQSQTRHGVQTWRCDNIHLAADGRVPQHHHAVVRQLVGMIHATDPDLFLGVQDFPVGAGRRWSLFPSGHPRRVFSFVGTGQ